MPVTREGVSDATLSLIEFMVWHRVPEEPTGPISLMIVTSAGPERVVHAKPVVSGEDGFVAKGDGRDFPLERDQLTYFGRKENETDLPAVDDLLAVVKKDGAEPEVVAFISRHTVREILLTSRGKANRQSGTEPS